jgi:hypothetical protein
LTEDNIRGHVKTVTIYYYGAVEKFGMVEEGELTGTKMMMYDTKGYMIENNELVRRSFYQYVFGEKNLPSERKAYRSDSSLADRVMYVYDKEGHKTEENIYAPDGTLHVKSMFKYDSVGNAVEQNSYDSKGALLSKFLYKYNETRNRIQYNGYRPDGRLMSHFTYRYDESGNTVLENQFVLNADDSTFSATTIRYNYPEADEKGNWTKQIVFNEQKVPAIIRTRELAYY